MKGHLSLLPLFFAATVHALPNPTVKLDQGTFIGSTNLNGSVTRFLGIPYGQTTAGNNRFRAPIPYPAYPRKTFNAQSYGHPCLGQQLDALKAPPGVNLSFSPSPIPPSEDCLTVNVISPYGTKQGDKLPVVVFLYGGGFESGSADANDGSVFVKQTAALAQPVIFVSLNFRASAWAWLASREIAEEGSGNFGLLDQRLALEWVQKYIKNFGGDPSKVVLWGESSGSMSVAFQLLVKNGDNEGLFRGAIMQSGFPLALHNFSYGQAAYDRVVENSGCAGTKNTLACLRNVSSQVLQKAVDATPNVFGFSTLNLAYKPLIDGSLITESTRKLVREGKVANVPVITGDTDDEGTLFTLPLLNLTTDEETKAYWKGNYYPEANSSVINKLGQLYPEDITKGSPFGTGTANAVTSQFKRLAAFQGDYIWQAPRRFFVENRVGKVKIWAYLSKRFKNTPELGAFHTSDLSLTLFETSDLQEYLINFVYNLDPNLAKPHSKPAFPLIHWPEYSASFKTFLTPLDANATTGVPAFELTKDDFRIEAIEYLNELADVFPM